MEAKKREVKPLPHHAQNTLCTTRSPYRQGRKLTAVKVYTVTDESQHIIISGVPALGLQDELRKLCERYGDIKSFSCVPNYSSEKFVDVYHVHYTRIQSARFGKRQMDGRAFFGGSLHVCYAPEMESISETRTKLLLRRHEVARRCNSHGLSPKLARPWSTSPNSEGLITNLSHGTRAESCIWNGHEALRDPCLLQPVKNLPKPHDRDWSDAGVRKVFIQAIQRKNSNSAGNPCTKLPYVPLHHPLTTSTTVTCKSADVQPSCSNPINPVPPILRLVPSQVKGAQKKIVFHPKLTEPSHSSGNQSLDETIQQVREKIRSVSAPNVKILLMRDKKEHKLFST